MHTRVWSISPPERAPSLPAGGDAHPPGGYGRGVSKETRHVLVLHSLRTILPIQEEIDRGLPAALQTTSRYPVDIDTEFLDLDRFEEAAYLDELLVLLRRKYAHRRPGCHHPRLSPGRKFFAEVRRAQSFPACLWFSPPNSKQFLPNLTLKPNMTGVYAEPAIAGNLKLALTLKPQTRQVVVVGGTSRLDRVHLSWVREAFAPFANQVEFTYLTDLTHRRNPGTGSPSAPTYHYPFCNPLPATAKAGNFRRGTPSTCWPRRPMPRFSVFGTRCWARALWAAP